MWNRFLKNLRFSSPEIQNWNSKADKISLVYHTNQTKNNEKKAKQKKTDEQLINYEHFSVLANDMVTRVKSEKTVDSQQSR